MDKRKNMKKVFEVIMCEVCVEVLSVGSENLYHYICIALFVSMGIENKINLPLVICPIEIVNMHAFFVFLL